MPRPLRELFVDRDRQIANFRRTLAGLSSKRIVIVTAGEGMGKSWLLQRFVQECAERKLPHGLIDFGDGIAYDALMLARRFRDQLGASEFNELTRTINELTTPRLQISSDPSNPSSGISFGSDNTQQDINISVAGDVAGRDVIKDNLFIVQTDSALIRQALDERVTAVFLKELQALDQRSQVVLLFDTYERNSLDPEQWQPNVADRWISRNLLEPIRDGLLRQAIVVLAGRRTPTFGAEWNDVLGTMSLPGFEQQDVTQYLRHNRGLTALSDEQVSALYTAVQGNPTLLGVIGDNLEKSTTTAKDDIW